MQGSIELVRGQGYSFYLSGEHGPFRASMDTGPRLVRKQGPIWCVCEPNTWFSKDIRIQFWPMWGQESTQLSWARGQVGLYETGPPSWLTQGQKPAWPGWAPRAYESLGKKVPALACPGMGPGKYQSCVGLSCTQMNEMTCGWLLLGHLMYTYPFVLRISLPVP